MGSVRTRVLFYHDPDLAWRQVLMPWFRFWPREAWKQDQPVIFLAPDSAAIAWVKGRLVQAGVPALGVQFFTPGGLRALLRDNARPLALREDLRLLMELAAAELPDNPVAQSAREPSEFLQHCDRLDAAGWGPDAFDLPEARELAQHFYQLVEASGLQTSAAADRALTKETEPRIAQVLAYGFAPGHGGALTLLRALQALARSAIYCLPAIGQEGDELAWRATLELLGDTDDLAEPNDRPLAALADAAENFDRLPEGEAGLRVVLAADITTEARVIENEIHRWRHELAPGERIGVVFAHDGQPLAREVARRLVDAGIAHQDEIGHQPGQRPAQGLAEAWRLYQERADADSVRQFVRALRRAGRISPPEEHAVWKSLERAFGEAMTTQLAVLRPLVDRQYRGEQAARLLDAWPLLPAHATFREYTALCLPVLKKLRWPERLDAWEHRAAALSENLRRPLERGQYLRWLAEVCRIPGRTRDGLGREAFAPIVLTTVERAAAQSWRCLVFAGLNRGDWPAEQSDSLLLSARLCQQLNRRAMMDSPVGQGQQCLRPARSWLASRLDERRRFAGQCASLLRQVRGEACFTAHRENPGEPGREQDLADWLTRLFHAQFGRLSSDDELREASDATAETFASESAKADVFPEITQAWSRRRDPLTPFDQYSFCFAAPPEEPLTLSCRAWEDALKFPGHAWFRHVLQVQPLEELLSQSPRSQMVGNWAHQWAQAPAPKNQFIDRPDAAEWTRLVDRAAMQVRQRVEAAYAQAGRTLPDWWRIDWATARRLAHQFAAALIDLEYPAFAAEWELPYAPLNNATHALHGLPLGGRIDALVSDGLPEELNHGADHWPSECLAWIIDFKTGADRPLTTSRLEKGDGVQLALYALALHARGAEQIRTSLLTPGAEVVDQVSIEQIQLLDGPWEILREQAFNGRFGLRGPQRSQYSFVGHYPTAHLTVKTGVLEEKWARTHSLNSAIYVNGR